MTFSDLRTDRENALRPIVVLRAHRSEYSGWMLAVHGSYRSRRQAEREAESLIADHCVHARVERWPNRDGGEVVLREFGVSPDMECC